MSEIRLDVITKRPVIFTNTRENKPTDLWDGKVMKMFEKFDNVEYSRSCPFCVGNESMTPECIYENNNGNSTVKIIPNLYPIIQNEIDIMPISDYCYFSMGMHDVIVESSLHNDTYFTMSSEQFYEIYKTVHRRYVELMKDENISYVSFFKNYKMLGGASMQHSHSQILAIDATPLKLNNEIECARESYEKKKTCPFCDMIKFEMRKRKRVIFENEKFIAIEPYAAAYKYETHIYPKRHISSFENEDDILQLSQTIHKVFNMLYNTIGDFPFNLYLNSLLKTKKDYKDSYHYSFRIIPKITGSAGFEMASGIRVNSVYPEDATNMILSKNK